MFLEKPGLFASACEYLTNFIQTWARCGKLRKQNRKCGDPQPNPFDRLEFHRINHQVLSISKILLASPSQLRIY